MKHSVASNREILWNSVEKAEDKSNRCASAQTARAIMLALPNEIEIAQEERIDLVTKFVSEVFVSLGMIADIAIHDKGDGNPHTHILLSMRDVGPDGFGKKNREWNKLLKTWRSEWARAQNYLLMSKGLDARVASKSHKKRGDDEHKPTLHLGPALSAMEKKGIKTLKGEYNRAILAERVQKELDRKQEREKIRNQDRERGR